MVGRLCFWKYLAGKKNILELQCVSLCYKFCTNPGLEPSDLEGIQGQKERLLAELWSKIK